MNRTPEKDTYVRTNFQLYQKHLNDHPRIIEFLDTVKNLRENEIVPFVNLNNLQDKKIKNRLAFYIPYFMRKYEEQLCQGDTSVSLPMSLFIP